VSLTQSFEQSMLDNVTLQAFVVCLAASWQCAIQPSGSWPHNLSWILANQRFHSDVKNEHPVVPNAITKWHHADVGNVLIACNPKSIDRFTPPEKGNACSLTCVA
jgi:hypothetical protein